MLKWYATTTSAFFLIKHDFNYFNIEGLLELNAEAPIFVQMRLVAQTPVVVAPVALPRETFVVR